MGKVIQYGGADLYPKQREAIFAPERIALCEASTKAGKSVGCLAWLFEQAIQLHKGQNVWWVAPVFSQSEDMFRRMQLMIPEAYYKRNLSKLTITLANGATIWFKSGNHSEDLYGADVYAVVLSEASRMGVDAWVAVRSTLSFTGGPVRMIGNVRGRNNWFYKLCREAETGAEGMTYHRITWEDAVAAGVLDRREIDDAYRDFSRLGKVGMWKQLYEAVAVSEDENPFGLAAIEACLIPNETMRVQASGDARWENPAELWPRAAGVNLAGRGAQNVNPAAETHERDFTAIVKLDREGIATHVERFRDSHQETQDRILATLGPTMALVDSTGAGDQQVEAMQKRVGPRVEGFIFTQRSRQDLLEGLGLALGEGRIAFPDGPLRDELDSFEYAYTGGGVRFQVPGGQHDDCLGTLVKTSSGYRPIEEVEPGDLVLTHRGRYREVTRALVRPFSGVFHEAKFRAQAPLEMSANHPIYVASWGYKGYKRSETMERRRFGLLADWRSEQRAVTVIHALADAPEDLCVAEEFYAPTPYDLLLAVPLNAVFARLLGRFVADGHCRKPTDTSRYGMVLAFNAKTEVGDLERYESYLTRLGIRVSRRQEPGCVSLVFSSRLLFTMLSETYDANRERVLPPWAFRLGSRLKHTLAEWLVADGWHNDDRAHAIGCTTSLRLALEMRDIALSTGSYASLSRKPGQLRAGNYGKDQWWVTIPDNGAWPAGAHLRRISSFEAASRAKEITASQFEGLVYNLAVAEDESFVANGLVVHNCAIALALAVKKLPYRRGSGIRGPIGVRKPGGSLWTEEGATARAEPSLLGDPRAEAPPVEDAPPVPMPILVRNPGYGGTSKWRGADR